MFRNCKIRPRILHRGMGEGEVEPEVSSVEMFALCQCISACMAPCISVCCSPHAAASIDCVGSETPASTSRLADYQHTHPTFCACLLS